VALLFAPQLGLGERYEFVLYRALGISRGHAMRLLAWIILVLAILSYRHSILSYLQNVHWHSIGSKIMKDMRAKPPSAMLFSDQGKHAQCSEWLSAIVCTVFFTLLFFILLFKNVQGIRDFFDMHWHQAYLDYDLNWGTPILSLGGNLLNNFGIQVPFNTSLSPFLGLSHVVASEYEALLSVSLFYVGMSLLFWAIGGTIKLRPVPRATAAGLTALIGTIPFGIDTLLPFIPPYLFVSQATLTRGYWEEVTVLSISAIYLFLCLGRCPRTGGNVALGVAFALLVYVVLLSFPANAFFSAPVIALYCCAFLLTCEQVKEFGWKFAAATAIALSMFLFRLPKFFVNLYSYTFGAYFSDLMMKWPTKWQLFLSSSMALIDSYDFRVPFIIAVALTSAAYVIVRGRGMLRRIALGLLVCEGGLLMMGLINAVIVRDPLSFNYAEQIHAPLMLFFFTLAALTAGLVLITVLNAVVVVMFEALETLVSCTQYYDTELHFFSCPCPYLSQ